MKTAIFGGTFNPPHIGHLLIAEEVLVQTEYQAVLFIPAYIPPHKKVEDPGAEIRLDMLRQSVADNPRFSVSDCEIRRAGVSYTIDTIRFLVAGGIVESRPGLIIGDDLIDGFETWKEKDTLAQESSLIVAHRRFPGRLPMPYPHRYIDNALFPFSSSEIRKKIAEGGAWRYLVPEAARNTIEALYLYGLQRN